jgi:hypothetical protein
MPRFAVVLAAMASMISGGCAAISTRSLAGGAQAASTDEGLKGTISTGPSRFLQSEPVDVPFLLHLEYQRPPYDLTLRVEDAQRQFEAFEVREVRIRYETQPERTITPRQTVERFEEGHDGQEVFVHILDALPRHAPVDVTITAEAIRPDGTRVPLEFQERFSPNSLDWIGDWFSWATSA